MQGGFETRPYRGKVSAPSIVIAWGRV